MPVVPRVTRGDAACALALTAGRAPSQPSDKLDRMPAPTPTATPSPQATPPPLPDPMAARDVIDLLLLSVLWGAAYLFMRAAVPAFGPAPMIALRFGLAALLLMPIMLWRGGWPVLRAHPRQMLIVGVPYTAVPFMLLAYGSLHLTAGLVAISPLRVARSRTSLNLAR